jgi:putative oxidoreductase
MNRLNRIREHVLGIFRIVVGFLFACHGAKTLFGILGAEAPATVGAWPGWWAGLIQFVGGVLLCLGIGARVVAFISSGSMAFAYFSVHASNGLLPIQNRGELAAMFCWVLFLLACTGGGRFALADLFRSVQASDAELSTADPAAADANLVRRA